MDALQKLIGDSHERSERYIASRPPIEQAILRGLIAENEKEWQQIEDAALYGDGSAPPEGVITP